MFDDGEPSAVRLRDVDVPSDMVLPGDNFGRSTRTFCNPRVVERPDEHLAAALFGPATLLTLLLDRPRQPALNQRSVSAEEGNALPDDRRCSFASSIGDTSFTRTVDTTELRSNSEIRKRRLHRRTANGAVGERAAIRTLPRSRFGMPATLRPALARATAALIAEATLPARRRGARSLSRDTRAALQQFEPRGTIPYSRRRSAVRSSAAPSPRNEC
jgi:hypothetical protein